MKVYLLELTHINGTSIISDVFETGLDANAQLLAIINDPDITAILQYGRVFSMETIPAREPTKPS